jgi:hypothetical protein
MCRATTDDFDAVVEEARPLKGLQMQQVKSLRQSEHTIQEANSSMVQRQIGGILKHQDVKLNRKKNWCSCSL